MSSVGADGGVKLELESEACCVCGREDGELLSPEEHDAGAPPARARPPLRAMLVHLNNNKVVPPGRLCSGCICRAEDAYSFSAALAARGSPPLSEKIRSLRKRLAELTQKIDVFIVVGGEGAGGGYGEDDVIMVERAALQAAERADRAAAAPRSADARGQPAYQCTVCPDTFQRISEFRAHSAAHGAAAAHWCWACGAACASPRALDEHARTHAPHDPLHCNLCNTTYQSSAELRRHEAGCPSVCPMPGCGAAFGARAALRQHAAGHAALCRACLLPCASPAARTAHAALHHTQHHYVCGYRACILRFTSRANLMSHIRKCHGAGDSPPPAHATPAAVPCAHCPRTFASAPAMKRHARTHHQRDVSQHQEAEAEDRVEYLEVEALDDMEHDGAH